MELCDWQCTREALKRLETALGCGVCHELLQEPCTLGSCDHLFCRSCVAAHLGNTCPVCHAPAWVKDLQLKRELASVVSLYTKFCSIINHDASEKSAVVKESTTPSGQHEGRHVEIEVKGQEVLVGGSDDGETLVAMEMDDTSRKALRPRNVLTKVEVAPSGVKKKVVKNSRPKSSKGRSDEKRPKGKEISVHEGHLMQENGTSKSLSLDGGSSSSENELIDPMSVYDFVPSPQRPKPPAKKRVRKPNPKTVKRQRVAEANRRWLRGDKSSKAGGSSESGADSDRSLRHVSFSIDTDQSKASSDDASSLESMEISSQDEIPPAASDDTHSTTVADTPGSTQDSGYNTGSNLDTFSLNEKEPVHTVNSKVNTPPPTPQNNVGFLINKSPNFNCNGHNTSRVDPASKAGEISQTTKGSPSPSTEMEPPTSAAPKRKLPRCNQGNKASAETDKQSEVQKLPPNSNANKNLSEKHEEPQARPTRHRSSARTDTTEENASGPSKQRRLRDRKMEKNVSHHSSSQDAGTKEESISEVKNVNSSPENCLPTSQPSRLTRTRNPQRNSSSPSTLKTLQKGSDETAMVERKEDGNSSSSEKHHGPRATTSPRNASSAMKRNKRGETPLHVAVIKGDLKTARQLLQEGANPNAKDNAGWTPLHEACNHGHTSIVEVLLDCGALINTPGFEHDSPLHDAVTNHRLDVVKLLLERGASLSVRNMHGLTPADYARSEPMKKVLKTKPVVAMTTQTLSTTSQKSLLSRNQPVVLLGTGLKDAERKRLQACAKLLGGGQVVSDFGSEVTHLVATCNHDNLCMRTMKYLHAILKGVWVVSFNWVTECLRTKTHAAEIEFEVKGTTILPTSAGPEKGRKNTEQQLPGLLDGCHFYLYSTFSPPTPSRQEIVQLIKNGGGMILSRQPKPDDDIIQASTTIPYHACPGSQLATCSYYIIHDHDGGRAPPRVRTGKLCTAPVSWLMDCITQFELMDLPD